MALNVGRRRICDGFVVVEKLQNADKDDINKLYQGRVTIPEYRLFAHIHSENRVNDIPVTYLMYIIAVIGFVGLIFGIVSSTITIIEPGNGTAIGGFGITGSIISAIAIFGQNYVYFKTESSKNLLEDAAEYQFYKKRGYPYLLQITMGDSRRRLLEITYDDPRKQPDYYVIVYS